MARAVLNDTRGDTLLWSGAQNPGHAPPVPARASVRTPREASLTPRPPSAQTPRAAAAAAAGPAGTGRGVNSDVHLPRPEDGGVPGTGHRALQRGLRLWTAPAGGPTPTRAPALQDPGRSQPTGTPGQREHCSSSFPSLGPEPTVDTSRSHPRHPDDRALMPGALEKPEVPQTRTHTHSLTHIVSLTHTTKTLGNTLRVSQNARSRSFP